jgi:type I restriction enzyme M protein
MESPMNSTLPFMPSDSEHLTVSELETWLWDAACAIRGATDAPKFKDFILLLVACSVLLPGCNV